MSTPARPQGSRRASVYRGVVAAVVGRLLDFSSRGDVPRFSPEKALALARGIIPDL